MTKIDLSVVIVSYNTKDILKDCLDSIVLHTKGISYEVIVVDNGSKDGSVEMVSSYHKKHSIVKLVDANENLGFGKGNNLGVKASVGEYILFLNSDTLLTSNSLKNSLIKIKSLKNCGLYSCQLLNQDGSVQASGGHFPTLFNVYAWQLGLDDLPYIRTRLSSFHPHLDNYKANQKLDWVTGAFLIIPKKVFVEVGMFDEKIFMYTEEMELAYRISKYGLSSYLDNEVQIIHLGGASGGSVLAITSEVKYMIYFWKKHMPFWQVPLVKIAFFLGSLLRLILFGIIKQDEKLKRAYTQALKLSL